MSDNENASGKTDFQSVKMGEVFTHFSTRASWNIKCWVTIAMQKIYIIQLYGTPNTTATASPTWASTSSISGINLKVDQVQEEVLGDASFPHPKCPPLLPTQPDT